MKPILVSALILISMGCGQTTPESVPAPVPPGSLTALYTDPEGNAKMITQESATLTQFVANSVITTPPGAQFTITLPDRTTILLNATSSVKILQFNDTARTVSLSGEAYFNATSNPNAPFVVQTHEATITALGTTFNVLTYSDEPRRATTLVEGALQVKTKAGMVSLKPGQQVAVNRSLEATEADLENTLAWKDGYYDGHVGTLIRQLARWHGLQVVYRTGEPALIFEGKIARSNDLESILTILRSNKISIELDTEEKRLVL